MGAVLRYERRRARERGENDASLGRELIDQIIANLRERFDPHQVERIFIVPDFHNNPQVGLTQSQLNNIQLAKFNSKVDKEDTCCICLDNFKDGTDIRKLECKHYYHKKCLD